MNNAVGIGQGITQHHVAAAFAEHGVAGCRGGAQPGQETGVVGQTARVQFRVAAGKVHRVGIRRRGLVGERRKERDFGSGVTPAVKYMRVAERESPVAGDRDLLAEWRQGRRIGGAGGLRRVGQGAQGVHIDMGGHGFAGGIEKRLQVAVLAGLNQPQMTFG